jgi:predicted dehydrogenase/threonine dehydrogenase-like Zn-dependent dehydrogenase
MKQIVQNLKTGEVAVTEAPIPTVQRGFVQVRAAASLISSGTERLTVEAGRQSLVGRALEQPQLVKRVFDRARTEGILNTVESVRSKLGSLVALGYSAAGTVIGVNEVSDFRTGDRVACAGLGYACHAEILSVPKNLCVRIPVSVDFDHAAFSTLGAIALQGLRLAGPTLGESVVVIGLGLVGQITVQLLKANGCRVFGIDLEASKIQLAQTLGADAGCASGADANQRVLDWSQGRGADAVIIAAATASNEPVELAGEISRAKGRVIVVGAVGLNVPRKPYYDRELTFRISMSYGPGRYDPEYEERGHDYPFAYVRWSEGRNIEAFLDLVARGSVKLEPLITHRIAIDDGARAYQLITGEINEPCLGVVLKYDSARQVSTRIELVAKQPFTSAGRSVRIGMIGAGDYAKSMLLPHFKTEGVEFRSIATASGLSARAVGEKYGFGFCASNADEVIDDDAVNLVVIATRNASHAGLALRALARGKHVFVEKPLAVNDEELNRVVEAANQSEARLMVGFNRRFSPLANAAREFLQSRQTPLSINYRINAGKVPGNHWIYDPGEGSRIIGEVCHFIDFVHFITGSLTTRVYAEPISTRNENDRNDESIFITLRLADGSNASIAYLATGDPRLPKERIEIFGAGKSFVIEDFITAIGYHGGQEKQTRLRKRDKGQKSEIRTVCSVVLEGKPAPIALEDLATTTRATFRILDSLRTGLPVDV